jgi:glycopeptide antibiotics resistance protein
VSFAIYVLLLVWIVMWKLGMPHLGDGHLRQLKLVPFVASGLHGGSAPAEVVVNLLLFVPFGLYLSCLKPAWPWVRAALTMCGVSVAMEGAQYVLAVGSSDVTDVITNTAGGVAGLALVALIRHVRAGRAISTVRRLCLASTALVVAATLAFLASPVRFDGPARPPGCGFDRGAAAGTHEVTCAQSAGAR